MQKSMVLGLEYTIENTIENWCGCGCRAGPPHHPRVQASSSIVTLV